MGDRDYKVIYKTRTLDKNEERPQVPTALDPYTNPYASGRKSSARDSTTSVGESSSATEVARSTTRTSYPVREDDRYRDVYVDTRRSTKSEAPPPDDISVRRSVVVDQRRDDRSSRQPSSHVESRSNRDRNYRDVDVSGPRDRGREYIVDDRPRAPGAPYIIDTRQGDIIDISVAGRDRDRGYNRGRQQYAYSRDNERAPYPRSIDEASGRNIVVVDRDYAGQSRRRDYHDNRVQRSTGRDYDYDRDEDWRLVDSMRDTRIGSTRGSEAPTERAPRSRAPTYSSEDSYVMVSPKQASRPRDRSRSRSAIARTDYPESEVTRRRSRSVSFRGSQISRHDASERKHERPGAEAEICGPYLRRPVSDIDGGVDTYSAYQGTDRKSRGRGSEQSTATYRERDEPYGPQLDHNPTKRSRSRRSRRDTEADDASYYSEKLVKKTTREYR